MGDGTTDPLGAGLDLRDLEIAMALVDIARAAQHGLSQLDRDLLGVADWRPLVDAVTRWEKLTNQKGSAA